MDGAAECSIKVIARVRPLNESEEKAGSKFVLKFPTDDSISVAVRFDSISVVVRFDSILTLFLLPYVLF